MRPIVRLLLFDVVLATVHLASDLFLVYSYFFLTDDPWWGAVTIVAICLPGLLGEFSPLVTSYTGCPKKMSFKEI